MRRYRLSNPSPGAPSIEDRLFQSLYGQAASPEMPAPQPPNVERAIYGDTAPERNAILLTRLIRAETGPKQRSKYGIVE